MDTVRRDTSAARDTTAKQDSAAGPLVTYPNGLQFQDLVLGKGPPVSSYREVTLHYVGKLLNGQVFDSSRDAGQPFTIVIGSTQLVPGFTQGLKGMRVGGMRKIIIPPSLGYGSVGFPDRGIPANATLIFEVEVLSIK